MTAPREVVRDPVPWATQPAARAWLLGYVRTDLPGYRELNTSLGALVSPASSTGYRFDAYLTAIEAAKTTHDGWSWSTAGRVLGEEVGDPVIFTDRLGWVCGFGTGGMSSVFIPPAGIPLVAATWTSVETDAERRQIVDRHRRNQGYTWGSASVWRCVLTMDRYSLQALEAGWCLRGRVCLAGVDYLDTPISVSELKGAIDGYMLGVESVRWMDGPQHHAQVVLHIVTA